ncbi:hypothetical protein CAPTEDRAFT_134280 [Capitella teleta]|uniref:Uncharacterized protein n=2 Tax=Capitella teleta TaxID=283909 RepID=R7UBJ2_CAPTE|nr:hypothetical protein CAPTEDRAFT_134280 [Capitella teleta]|eukprot:ELU00637.1 hypothetical protein CAPTEDRAFT_134280 [Capitella teleta]
MITAAFTAYKLFKGLRVLFNQFVLGKLFGPALDLKKLGKWAGKNYSGQLKVFLFFILSPVVTGATDGIGLAYAKQLAERGIPIVLVSRSQEKLDKCAREIEQKYHVETKTIAFDFTKPYDSYGAVKKGLAGLEVGFLLNNVGIGVDPIRLTETPNCEKVLNDICHVNALSAAMMTYYVLPGMMQRRKGAIVNNASFSAYIPVPFMSVYPATKSFVDYFSRGMSMECASHGIFVQSLMPHFVQTKILNNNDPPSLFRPSPESFCRSAIGTVGRAERTFGYFPHHILSWLADMLGEKVVFEMLRKEFMDIRSKTLKKLGVAPQD